MSESKAGSSEPEKKVEPTDFETALRRLEEIVQMLEAGNLSLEEGMKLFEEGMKLSRFCTEKLEEAERKVEILVKNAKGEMVEQPFRLEEEAGTQDVGDEDQSR